MSVSRVCLSVCVSHSTHPTTCTCTYLVGPRQGRGVPADLPQQVAEVHEGVGELRDEERKGAVRTRAVRRPARPHPEEAGAVVEELHEVVPVSIGSLFGGFVSRRGVCLGWWWW